MQSLRRWGGGAGLLAGVAGAWEFVAFAFVLPAAGLGLTDLRDPDKFLPFIATHRILLWFVDFLGLFLGSLLGLVLLLALGDRFREEAPARSRVGPLFGIVGATGFAIAILIRHFGNGFLATLYATDKVAAAHAFYALRGANDSFAALGGVGVGLGVLLLGTIMSGIGRYSGAGYLGVITGAVLILGVVVPSFPLVAARIVLIVLLTLWLIWTGSILRSEAATA